VQHNLLQVNGKEEQYLQRIQERDQELKQAHEQFTYLKKEFD